MDGIYVRFSQRQILLNYPSTSDLIQYVSSTLFLPGTDTITKRWNSSVKKIVLHKDFSRLLEEQSTICPLSYHILSIDGCWNLHDRWFQSSDSSATLQIAYLHFFLYNSIMERLFWYDYETEYSES